MPNAPHMWLSYRPVRIGSLVSQRSLSQLAKAASLSTALWGGKFNPIIPINDGPLSEQLIRTFQVDLMLPIEQNEDSRRFVERFPELHAPLWSNPVFERGRCNFVDVRHPARKASERLAGSRIAPPRFLRPTWEPDDELDILMTVLVGRYPPVEEISLNYAKGLEASIDYRELPLKQEDPIPSELLEGVVPLDLSSLEVTLDGRPLGWLAPGATPRLLTILSYSGICALRVRRSFSMITSALLAYTVTRLRF